MLETEGWESYVSPISSYNLILKNFFEQFFSPEEFFRGQSEQRKLALISPRKKFPVLSQRGSASTPLQLESPMQSSATGEGLSGA